MKTIKTFILAAALTTAISQSAFAAGIPIESAPCNATAESIAITETLIADELEAVKNGMGYQPAWAKANKAIFDAVLSGQTNGYGYADIANIARNALLQYRDMYLRPEYYKLQNDRVYNLIYDLIDDVKNGKPYNEALDEAYTRIYKSIDPSYVPNTDLAVDKVYLDIPATDIVMFGAARKYLLEAIPQVQ